MLFAGNIGQFPMTGPFPFGVDGLTVSTTIVSTGTAVAVSVETIEVSIGDVEVGCGEVGMQADKNKAETIRMIFIFINPLYYRLFVRLVGRRVISRRVVRIRFRPIPPYTNRRAPGTDATDLIRRAPSRCDPFPHRLHRSKFGRVPIRESIHRDESMVGQASGAMESSLHPTR